MDETPNLSLPYIMPAQAQKHVTHNEAIRALDALVQLAVLDRDLSAPPGSPPDGGRYIVAASPSGTWTGQGGNIAAWQDGAWAFYVPLEGWIAWVADEDALVAWDGSAWIAAGGGGGGPFTTLGINATADTTNRLSLKSPASLFDNEGAGHQHKINKAAAGDTASLLLQTNYSGRAEIGATGDDNFHVKVSADGSVWKEALVVDRTTGALTPGQPRLSCGEFGTWHVLAKSAVASSHTGNTTETTLATVTVPANAMGANGSIRITTLWGMTASANNKTLRIRFGGTGGTLYRDHINTNSAVQSLRNVVQIDNRNNTGSQVGGSPDAVGGLGNAGPTVQTSSVDTTADVDIVIRCVLAIGSDTITLHSYLIEILRRN